MPNFSRGKLQFEHRETGSVTGSQDTIETFTCMPPPAGRRTGGNPVLTINPHQPASHMQPEEKRRIETFGKKTANENLALSTVVTEIKDAFKIKPLTIDLTKVPQDWRKVVPCYDIVIAVVVESILLRIDVNAREAVTLDGVTWPEGDSVAQFRIVVPDRYKFVKTKTRNINCCPLNDGAQMPPPETEDGAWSARNFTPFSYGFGLKYDLEWRLRFGLRYRMYDDYWLHPKYYEGWFEEENERGEDQPDQPWIFPKFEFKF